jgi:hypothetical protein
MTPLEIDSKRMRSRRSFVLLPDMAISRRFLNNAPERLDRIPARFVGCTSFATFYADSAKLLTKDDGGSRFSFPFVSPPDQTSHPHPIGSMVTKICHHAAVVYVRAARW